MYKAQVQAISMVLMAGIVLGLAGAAYMWGAPMIEKRTTTTDVSIAQSFILELNERITDVARNGGTKAVTIPGISGSSVNVNESGNEILYRFLTTQSMLGMGENSVAIPIETQDTDPIGPYGGSPRIIMLEGEPVENGGYLMTLRLKYRELQATEPPKGYKIVLSEAPSLAESSAPSKVSVTFDGTNTDTGGPVEITETLIEVQLS